MTDFYTLTTYTKYVPAFIDSNFLSLIDGSKTFTSFNMSGAGDGLHTIRAPLSMTTSYRLFEGSLNVFGFEHLYNGNANLYSIRSFDNNSVSVARLSIERSSGNVGIGLSLAAYLLHANGEIALNELSADPADPTEGSTVMWMSDGTGYGDDGDLVAKIKAAGTTKTFTVIDFTP